MTINFNNVYLKDVSTVAGKDEKNGSFGNLYDKTYNDYYMNQKTFEQAEINMIKESMEILLKKTGYSLDDINVILGSDLSNQLALNSYAMVNNNKPYFGIYSACASSAEEMIIGSLLIEQDKINNCIINTSSHNMTSERQFRNPVEYGYPKPKRSTFTVTGASSILLSKEKSNIKITSGTIGKVIDKDIKDPYDMGSVMAPAAAECIYDHLTDTNLKSNYYDLILTGDLGCSGKKILSEYLIKNHNINIENILEDASSVIYKRDVQKHVNQGGSGPACLPLVFNTYILDKIKNNSYKKILLVATGALMNTTLNNQKLSIPAIAHAISLEVIK